MITANEILIKASEFLNEENWCKGSYEIVLSTGTKYRAMGAMRMMAYGNASPPINGESVDAMRKAIQAVRSIIGPQEIPKTAEDFTGDIPIFNDHHAKDVYDVKDVLRRAGEAC